MSLRDQAEQILTSVKIAVATGVTTTGAGVGTWFDVIPNDIGKLASLMGAILTIILAYFHVKKGVIDIAIKKLEYEMKKDKAARSQAAEDD